MPVGAFGGERAIMEKIAPLGPVYQAGTLSGNPVAVAAGLATLREIEAPGFYEALAARTQSLTEGLTAAAERAGVPFAAQAVGGMFGLYFAERVPDTYDAVMACDKERFNRFFHAMLDAGVYLAPSAFEAGFVSAAHTADDIATTVALADEGVRGGPRLTFPGANQRGVSSAAFVASRYARPKARSGSRWQPSAHSFHALMNTSCASEGCERAVCWRIAVSHRW